MRLKAQLPGWLTAFLFLSVPIYYEIVLHISTLQTFSFAGMVFMVLYSAVYAGTGYLIATISEKKRLNYFVAILWMILSAVPFLIEYFIYVQFNIFYDLNTCLNGAGDVLTGYTRELFLLIFSRNGLVHIFLFLLPTVLFAVLGMRYITLKKLPLRSWLISAVVLILVFLLSNFGISGIPALSLICNEEYNYQSVVSNLGLLTGLRLDIAEYLSPDSQETFEEVAVITPEMLSGKLDTTPEAAADPEDTAPVETEPVHYLPNVMEVDFDKKTSNASIKQLNSYVRAQTPSLKNQYTGLFKGKNLILITAEAFTAEVINPELTPTLYRLATKGIQFTDFYQPASCGTTGGEFQNIFGMLPGKGGGSFRATKDHLNYFTLGSQLDRLGYYGIAYHNHTHTYYDRDVTHNNLGYSEGFIGEGNGLEPYLSSLWPKSDVEMFTATVPAFLEKQPFNVYYMTYSGHCGYTAGENAFTKMHWDRVKDLNYGSKMVKGYLAAQLELEDAMTYLLEQLETAGIADDTVICLASDHFPYGLDSGGWSGAKSNLAKLYGHPVRNMLERDHSGMILWCGCLEDMEPIVVDTPASTLDILPTLSNLFGTEFDSRMMVGRDVFSDAMPLVFNVGYDWKTEYGTYIANDYKFYPADESIEVPEGYVDSIKAIVRNKIRYCKQVLETDYYRYLFDEE